MPVNIIGAAQFPINQTIDFERYHQKMYLSALDQLNHMLMRVENWLHFLPTPPPPYETTEAIPLTDRLLKELHYMLRDLNFTQRGKNHGCKHYDWQPKLKQQ